MSSVLSLGTISSALSRDIVAGQMGNGLINQYVNKSFLNNVSSPVIFIPLISAPTWTTIYVNLMIVGCNAGGTCSVNFLNDFSFKPDGTIGAAGGGTSQGNYSSSVPYALTLQPFTYVSGTSTSPPMVIISYTVGAAAGDVDISVWCEVIQTQANPSSYNFLL